MKPERHEDCIHSGATWSDGTIWCHLREEWMDDDGATCEEGKTEREEARDD